MRPTGMSLILAAALFAAAADARAQQTPPSASLSPVQKAGEKLFLQRCSVCHLGSAPTYKPYGPSLAGIVETAGEVQIRTTVLSGLPGMPAWRYSLDGTQVDAVIAYMRTLKKP